MYKTIIVSISLLIFPLVTGAASLSDFVTFTGEGIINFAGQSLSAAGDVNGDGYDDFIVNSFMNSDNGTSAGAVYLIYGQENLLESASLATAVEFTGEAVGDYAGRSLAAVGDINNDGYDDILVGADLNDATGTDAGAVYLIYGQAVAFTSVNLNMAVRFTGEAAGDSAGSAVAGAGDINNDGYDDFIIGAPYNDTAQSNTGAAYLFYGRSALYTATSVTAGVKFTGEASGNAAGDAVSAAGDINNDGYDDFVIGASYKDNIGSVYLIYGQAAALAATNLSDSIELYGEGSQDRAGAHINVAGDVNADGYDDFVIGAANNDSSGGDGAGAVYLVYGRAAVFTTAGLLSVGTKFSGEVVGDQAGIYLGGSGDVNNDDYDDFIIGARLNDDAGVDTGAAYIVYGQSTQYSSASLAVMQEFTGVSAGELAGEGVDIAGDVNNDGYDDIIIAAAQNDNAAMNAGIVYLGYLTVDTDGDGVAGSDGVVTQGTDCNDNDPTVSAGQIYYVDADEDGLGSTVTEAVCSATPPTGYATNNDDTNDTIANAGVEISNDGVDNDNDGVIDEENTVAENGVHPGYADADPADSAAYASNVTSVVGGTNGTIIVTYSDASVYRYPIFTIATTITTDVAAFQNTGYLVVLHPTSKKLALVNVYNGTVYKKLALTKQAMTKKSFQQFDLRADDDTEVIVSSSKGKKVRLAVIQVNLEAETLILADRLKLSGKKIFPTRTVVKAKKIILKRKNKTIYTIRVKKSYQLVN